MSPQEAIKELRVELGISQVELAERLHVTSVTVSRWEIGKSIPQSSAGKKIITVAKSLGASEECLKHLQATVGGIKRSSISAKKYGFPDVDQDLLYKVIDVATVAIYVIEAETYRVLYINQKASKMACHKLDEAPNMKCYEYMWNMHTPCNNCPLKELNGYEITEDIYREYENHQLSIRGRKVKWNGKDIYITYVTDITNMPETKRGNDRFNL